MDGAGMGNDERLVNNNGENSGFWIQNSRFKVVLYGRYAETIGKGLYI